MNRPFEPLYERLPQVLRERADAHWQQLLRHHQSVDQVLDEAMSFKVKYCFALSDFVAESSIYCQEIFEQLFLSEAVVADLDWFSQRAELLDKVEQEAEFIPAIRRLRKLAMSAIAVTDILKQQSIEQSFTLVSQFSERLIVSAYHQAYAKVSEVFGTPLTADGVAMPMTILGMGKLGGGELNFSSDIDLIFCYPHSGQTQGGRKVVDNQQFFVKVAQKLIHYLDHNTADGVVFRVDMRLRPFGDSGPLVLSYSAMEDYYQEQGRDWERYAMLKAKVLGREDNPYATELEAMLRPFVYRRYIDFSVIESLRKMKLLISREARRRDEGSNIKLGTGGIREVEFIAQALQMIRGGREKQLQVRSLLLALQRLTTLGELSEEACRSLIDNYLFLRLCEHYLQQFNDKQTQWLPDDPINRARLTWLLEVSSWDECEQKIADVMAEVHRQFKLIIAESDDEPSEQLSPFEVFWQLPEAGEAAVLLPHLDETQQQDFVKRVTLFKAENRKRSIGGRGRSVLDQMMPQLLNIIAQTNESPDTLQRVLNVIARIASRTAYLELLNENDGALRQLVKLCAQSCWIAEQLSYQPILLDELIDPRVLYNPIALGEYRIELESHMIRIPEDDLEQQLEALRHFKLARQLHIAAADISRVLSVAQVSSHLSALAEACIACVVNIAWKQMAQRYGEPAGRSFQDKGFAVIAYGKLGGAELGYDSDLDVVFVHDCVGGTATDGAKAIDSRQFYLKLAQRIVHIFTSRTVSGILYDMDTRIRPQGNSGLLACHIDTFEAYLNEEAWTWEHQALVRARMVYGDVRLEQRFVAIRRQILTKARDVEVLKGEVLQMRDKMRDNLTRDFGLLFDIKQGLGGIVDIEFITQYLVLAHSRQYPQLTESTTNLKLFESFARLSMLSEEQVESLSHSYRQLRKMSHRLTLQKQDKLTDNEYARHLSEDIQQIWRGVFEQ